MKVYLLPEFAEQDKGDGGIRRVVEAQRKHLPAHGIEFVDSIQSADLVASHSGATLRFEVPPEKPYITHTHGLYWREYDWPKWSHALNMEVIRGMRLADAITVPSEWVGEVIKRGMWRRPVVLYHGVDLEDWDGAEDRGYVLWNKNRPDPVCDDSVVTALATRMPQMQFMATFGATNIPNMTITGRLPFVTAKDLVKNCGVYLATARETFGIGTLEAMAAGKPVVGWAWGGNPEIITHGVDGWLVKPNDYDGLAEGLEWAKANAVEVGQAARHTVETRFTWAQRISAYAKLYDDVYSAKAESYHVPAVSVIMPCYNLGRYLKDAINSVLRQSMNDWELIVVDDCSPDNTAEIVAQFTDPRIKYVRTPQNLYLAGALNYGVRQAKGRAILPLDADNMIEPRTLEILSRHLDTYRDTDIAYGAVRFVLEDGMRPDESVGRNGVSGWPVEFDFRGQMLQRNQIPSTALIRRRAWYHSGGWRTRCATAEDAENWTRLVSLGFDAKKVTDQPTLVYRQRQDSMSRVQTQWDWNSWYPWAARKELTPFGAAGSPPTDLNEGIAWNVPSYEPVMISVIIPVGPGHAKYLIDAIDSVQAQSFQNWEVIVVNDSEEPLVMDGMAGLPSWVKVFTTNKIGPGAARNAGVAQSKGRYILPLDADDYLQPNALGEMWQAISEYGGYIYSQWWDDFGDHRDVYDPPEYDANILTSKGAIHAVTILLTREDYDRVGGFDPDLSHWEDWDLQLRLADVPICGTKIPQPLFTYRKNTGSRREANMVEFDAGKDAILDRWRDLWEGRRTLAGCAGCRGARRVALPTPTANGMVMDERGAVMNDKPTTLIRFLGQGTNTREYKGSETNTQYRFANDASHKQKYVYNGDVPKLLMLMDGGAPMFAVVQPPPVEQAAPVTNEPTPALVAVGSPHAEQAPVASQPTSQGAAQSMGVATATGTVRAPSMTIREMGALVPDMGIDEVAQLLTEERSGANRVGALRILEGRMGES